MDKKNIEKIIDFLYNNKCQIVSFGSYNLPKEIITIAILDFIKNNDSDIIKKHQDWVFACWDIENIKNNKYLFDSIWYKNTINLKKFWDDKTDIKFLELKMKESVDREKTMKSYKHNRKIGFSNKLKKLCLERDKNICKKCGSCNNLEVDHIKELIDGGDNKIDNLQTLCRKCHIIKTNLSIKKRNGKTKIHKR